MTNIQNLRAGCSDFQRHYFSDNTELYKALSKGQSPKALVIACSDSRIDPALLMRAQPGDLFVLRNVANIVPPFKAKVHSIGSALEYGIKHLNIKHIIVLGHSQCGGIKALLNDEVTESDCIQDWINHAAPAKKRALEKHPPEEAQECCEQENIALSLENLLTYPWIKEATGTGEVQLHGWHFNISEGIVAHYDSQIRRFTMDT